MEKLHRIEKSRNDRKLAYRTDYQNRKFSKEGSKNWRKRRFIIHFSYDFLIFQQTWKTSKFEFLVSIFSKSSVIRFPSWVASSSVIVHFKARRRFTLSKFSWPLNRYVEMYQESHLWDLCSFLRWFSCFPAYFRLCSIDFSF